ncbi:Uncharacterised protein [Salmonella enterica subsp. arizonae]|nr:Uncharacterised protein [Salmonella enterica subsp. arizonae]
MSCRLTLSGDAENNSATLLFLISEFPDKHSLIFISYHNEITMLEFMLKRREDFIVNKTSQFSVAGELENSYAAGMKQDRDEWKNICVTAPCL